MIQTKGSSRAEAVALRSGNLNNGSHVGFAINLNNDAGNANWNIGSSQSYLTKR